MYTCIPSVIPDNENITTNSSAGNITLSPGSGTIGFNNANLINANISGSSTGTVLRSMAVQTNTVTASNSTAQQSLITGTSIGSFTYANGAMNSLYRGIRIMANGTVQITNSCTLGIVPYLGGTALTAEQFTPTTTIPSVTPFDFYMTYTCVLVDAGSSSGSVDTFWRLIIYSTPIITLSAHNIHTGINLISGFNLNVKSQFSVASTTNAIIMYSCTAEYF